VLSRAERLRAEFERFHAENPYVYSLFERFAFDAIRAGRKRFSAHAVIHRIRWYTQVETKSRDGFKINNNWFPFYARLFMRDHPEHEGFFCLRAAAADDEPAAPRFDPAGQGLLM
jgi:hypothetical protein